MGTWQRLLVAVLIIAVALIRALVPGVAEYLSRLSVDYVTIAAILVALVIAFFPILRSLAQAIDRVGKRWLLIVLCVTLVVLRVANSTIAVDQSVVWLVALAALLLVLPELKALTPYIKRIKVGDTEIELQEAIGKLSKEVDRAEEEASERGAPSTTSTQTTSDVEEVLEDTRKDPRAALLLLSSKIEGQLRQRLEEADIKTAGVYSLIRLVDIGVHQQVFTPDFGRAMRDFASVRNRVAHGEIFDVEDSYLYSLVSLGAQLLKIASTPMLKPGDRSNSGPSKA